MPDSGGSPQALQAELEVLLKFSDQGLVSGAKAAEAAIGGIRTAAGAASGAGGVAGLASATKMLTGGMPAQMMLLKGFAGGLMGISVAQGAVATGAKLLMAPFSAIGSVLKSMTSGLGGLATALLAVTLGMKDADSIANAYDESMSKAGVNGEKMLARLRKETEGLLSTETIQSNINKAYGLLGAGGMQAYVDKKKTMKDNTGPMAINNQEDLMVRLARGSMSLARSTGMDANDTFQRVIAGAVSRDTGQLRYLGVQTSYQEAITSWQKKTGETIGKGDEEKTQMAFMDLLIEKMKETETQFGISTGGIKTQAQILMNSLKDIGQSFAMNLGDPTFRPMLKAMASVAHAISIGITEPLTKLGNLMAHVPDTIRIFVMTLLTVPYAAKILSQSIMMLTGGQGIPLLGGILTALMGPLKWVLAGFLAFIPVIKAANSGPLKDLQVLLGLNKQKFDELGNAIEEANPLGDKLKSWLHEAGLYMEAFLYSLEPLGPMIRSVISDIGSGDWAGAWEGLKQTVMTGLGILLDWVVGWFAPEWGARLREAFAGGEGASAIGELFTEMWKDLSTSSSGFLAKARDVLSKIGSEIMSYITTDMSFGDLVGNLFNLLPEDIQSSIQGFVTTISEAFGQVDWSSLVSGIGEKLLNVLVGAWDWLMTNLPLMVQGLSKFLTEAFNEAIWVLGPLLFEWGPKIVGFLLAAIVEITADLIKLGGDIVKAIWKGIVLGSTGPEAQAKADEATQKMGTSIRESFMRVIAVLNTEFPMGQTVEAGAAPFEAAIDQITARQGQAIANMGVNIADLIGDGSGAATDAIAVAQGDIARIITDYSQGTITTWEEAQRQLMDVAAGAGLSGIQMDAWEALVGGWEADLSNSVLSAADSVLGLIAETARQIQDALALALNAGQSEMEAGAAADKFASRDKKNAGPQSIWEKMQGNLRGKMEDRLAKHTSGAAKPPMGTPPKPGEDGGGGGGKGPKEGKEKGGAEKDPLEEAYKAIDQVAKTIMSGIDAMNKVWAEFRGSPDKGTWKLVFDSLKDMVDGFVEIAGDLDPKKMEEVSQFAQMTSAITSALSAITSLTDQVMRMRTIDPSKMDRLIAFAGQIGKFGLDFTQSIFDHAKGQKSTGGAKGGKSDLEEIVKTITLGTQAAGMLSAYAQAVTGAANAANAMEGVRWEQSWGGVDAFMMRGADMLQKLKDRIVGDQITARNMIDMKDTAEMMGVLMTTIGGAAASATAVANGRMTGGDMGGVETFMNQAFDISTRLLARLRQSYGTEYLIAMEDLKEFAESFQGWVDIVGRVAESATALYGARFSKNQNSLMAAQSWLENLIGWANDFTNRMRATRAQGGGGNDYKKHIEELKLTADAVKGWLEVLKGTSEIPAQAEEFQKRMKFGIKLDVGPPLEMFRAVTAFIWGVAHELTGEGRTPAKLEDLHKTGEAVKVWMDTLAALKPILEMGELMSRQRKIGGSDINFGKMRDTIMGLLSVANVIFQGANSLGDQLGQGMADSALVAGAVGAWLAALAPIGELSQALYVADNRGVDDETVKRVFGIIKQVGLSAWEAFSAAITSPGGKSMNEASTSVAQNITSWITMLAGVGELAQSLYTAEQYGLANAKGRIASIMSFLRQMAVDAWMLFKDGGIGQPGYVDMQQASTELAKNLQAWVSLITSVGEMTRQLDLVIIPDQSKWNLAVALLFMSLADLMDISEEFVKKANALEDLSKMKAVVDALAPFVGMISSLADAGMSLQRMLEPTKDQWDAVEASAQQAMDILMRLTEKYIPKLIVRAQELTARATMAGTLVQAALAAVTAAFGVSVISYIPPSETDWAQMEATMLRAIDFVKGVANGLLGESTDPSILAKNKGLVDKITMVAGVVGAAASALSAVSGLDIQASRLTRLDDSIISVIEPNIEMLFHLFERLQILWQGQRRDPETDAKRITDFAGMVASLTGPIQSFFELGKLVAGQEIPTIPDELINKAVEFGQKVLAIFQILSEPYKHNFDPDDLERARRDQERAWAHLSAYADTISSVTGAVGSIVSAMSGLFAAQFQMTDLTDEMKKRLHDFAVQSIQLWRGLAEEYGIVDDASLVAWDRLAAYAESVSNIVGPLGDLAGVMGDLLDLKWTEEVDSRTGQSKKVLRNLELGADFIRSLTTNATDMLTAMKDMITTLLPQLFGPQDDQATYDALLDQLAKRAANISTVFQAVADIVAPITAWFGDGSGNGNPLFVQKKGSPFQTLVRVARADFLAEQLRLGIIRAGTAIVSGLKDVPAPDEAVVQRFTAIATATDALAAAIARAMEIAVPGRGEEGALLQHTQWMAQAANIIVGSLLVVDTLPASVVTATEALDRAVENVCRAITRAMQTKVDLSHIRDLLEAARMMKEINDLGGGGEDEPHGPRYDGPPGFKIGGGGRGRPETQVNVYLDGQQIGSKLKSSGSPSSRVQRKVSGSYGRLPTRP